LNEYIILKGEITMGLFDGFDKPVTKGDLWTAIAGVKIFDANEKAREKRQAETQKDHDWFHEQSRNRYRAINGLDDED
jgi:hypothetical protein